MSFYLHELWGNGVLISSVLAWLIAQIAKIFLFAMTHKKWDIERLVGSGGMPSSHSALVTALSTSIGILDGMNSEIFALACVFAAIVMYDAAGVRRAAGEQARILNTLLDEFDRGKGSVLPGSASCWGILRWKCWPERFWELPFLIVIMSLYNGIRERHGKRTSGRAVGGTGIF